MDPGFFDLESESEYVETWTISSYKYKYSKCNQITKRIAISSGNRSSSELQYQYDGSLDAGLGTTILILSLIGASFNIIGMSYL